MKTYAKIILLSSLLTLKAYGSTCTQNLEKLKQQVNIENFNQAVDRIGRYYQQEFKRGDSEFNTDVEVLKTKAKETAQWQLTNDKLSTEVCGDFSISREGTDYIPNVFCHVTPTELTVEDNHRVRVGNKMYIVIVKGVNNIYDTAKTKSTITFIDTSNDQRYTFTDKVADYTQMIDCENNTIAMGPGESNEGRAVQEKMRTTPSADANRAPASVSPAGSKSE